MSRHDLIVLTFLEPLRGRELRAGYLPSDLLWGALYAADVRLQDAPLSLDAPYRVSSAFPLAGGEWLLPKPRVSSEGGEGGEGAADPGDKKAVKRLEFVNLTDFLTLASGERLPAPRLAAAAARQRRALLPVSARELPFEMDGERLSRSLRGTRHVGQADTLARDRYAAPVASLSPAEHLHLSREARGRRASGLAERQRNTQDRVTAHTDIFTTAGLMQPRLAFLLESTSETQRTRLLAALRLLGDTGLGGMRTQGSGQFQWEAQPVPEALRPLLNAAGPQVLLSLTRPTPEEAEGIDRAPDSRYGLIRRDGFLDGTPLQRQDIWMLTEGSLVPAPLNGSVADVAPPNFAHPVWRSGLAVSVGVRP